MVVFVFIVIAVIVVIIVVRNKKRDEKVKFLLNMSDASYIALKIKDALVKEGYKVSEEPSIDFGPIYGLPYGNFSVSKGIEKGNIYFSTFPRGKIALGTLECRNNTRPPLCCRSRQTRRCWSFGNFISLRRFKRKQNKRQYRIR